MLDEGGKPPGLAPGAGGVSPTEGSEEDLLHDLEELRQALYRRTRGGKVLLSRRRLEEVQRISTQLDDLIVEVVKRRTQEA